MPAHTFLILLFLTVNSLHSSISSPSSRFSAPGPQDSILQSPVVNAELVVVVQVGNLIPLAKKGRGGGREREEVGPAVFVVVRGDVVNGREERLSLCRFSLAAERNLCPARNKFTRKSEQQKRNGDPTNLVDRAVEYP